MKDGDEDDEESQDTNMPAKTPEVGDTVAPYTIKGKEKQKGKHQTKAKKSKDPVTTVSSFFQVLLYPLSQSSSFKTEAEMQAVQPKEGKQSVGDSEKIAKPVLEEQVSPLSI